MAARGDIGALRQVLAEHPDNLNKRGPHNRALLWEAACRGQQQAVQWLVEQGAEVDATGCNNHESFVQLTPYCAAVYYHRPAVADYLASQGATLDIFRVAFMGDLARGSQVLDVHPELLNAEDPHDLIYHTPLLAFTVAGGQADMMDFLLNHGAIVPLYSAQLLTLAAKDARVVGADIFCAHARFTTDQISARARRISNAAAPLKGG